MKFLVDAQLPYRLVDLLRRAGLDLYILDLTLGNRTLIASLMVSVTQQRVVDKTRTLLTRSYWLAPW
jgi:predicted nuclease of predicted toxin-antitoxin system